MGNRLYVGNLPYSTTEDELRETFGAYGDVEQATIIVDRNTSRSKGFAFVEFVEDEAASSAIAGLNGTQFGGRTLRVDEARPRADEG